MVLRFCYYLINCSISYFIIAIFLIDLLINLDPVHTKPGIFEYGEFFLRIRLRWRVLKTEIHRIRVDRLKTEVFKYDDVMPKLKAHFSAHTIQKRYVWTQIFLNTEQKISVLENGRLRVDEALDIDWFIH